MKNTIIIVSLLLSVLLTGCETLSTKDTEPLQYEPIVVHPSKTLTLSQEQLLSLDWHSPHRRGGRVENIHPLASPGVEFDIYFPSNNPSDNEVTFVSSGEGGLGKLVGSTIEGYEQFGLKYTLVSINGRTDDPELNRKIMVGSLIGPTSTGNLKTYEPVTLSLNELEKTAVSMTKMQTKKIYQIGFHAQMVDPFEWETSPARITLRIEPLENAGPVPSMIPVKGQ